MSKQHGNAPDVGQFITFSGVVQSKLWPALKGRVTDEEIKSLINGEGPREVMRRLRRAFTMHEEASGLAVPSSPFFANEEVPSTYSYPQGFVVRSVPEQLLKLAPHFPGLNPEPTLKLYEQLPNLTSFVPEIWMGREIRRWVNWHVVPRRERVAATENEAVEKVLDLIGARTFYNYRKENLGPKYLRLSERTAIALQMIGEKQKGDFLLIPAQFGLVHRGRSVRRVRVVYAPNEFGLGSFIAGCMILSHPERLVRWEQLHIDCPGDEYSPNADGVFSDAPVFYFYDDGVRFSAYVVEWVDGVGEDCGSASGFVPASA